MTSIKYLFTLSLVLVLSIASLAQNSDAQYTSPQQAQQWQLLQQQQQQELYQQDGYNQHNSGILGMLVSPIRQTINQARRLFGHPLRSAYDGVDMVRLEAFRMYMSIYNKTYSAAEIPRRMAIFFDRRKVIEESVMAFREGRLPFMMRENAFIDWDEEELKALTGVSPPRTTNELAPEELDSFQRPNEVKGDLEEVEEGDEFMFGQQIDNSVNNNYIQHYAGRPVGGHHNRRARSVESAEFEDDDSLNLTVRADRIPASKDWRLSGCISKPINQMKCGACYAIASMSVVESMRCLNTRTGPTLSPQQVVDCSTPRAGYQNYGCNGGWPTRVFRYLQDTGVVTKERCYPFVRRQNACRLRQVQANPACAVSASPSDTQLRYKVLNNERDILYHVAKTGPVVTVMKATDKFVYYGSGIFDDPTCSRKRDDVDHAIVIVGYGRENGQDYWLIKNSWGTSEWGLNGYGKYKRGTNACSIGHWGWVVTS